MNEHRRRPRENDGSFRLTRSVTEPAVTNALYRHLVSTTDQMLNRIRHAGPSGVTDPEGIPFIQAFEDGHRLFQQTSTRESATTFRAACRLNINREIALPLDQGNPEMIRFG